MEYKKTLENKGLTMKKLLFALLLLPFPAMSGWFGPSNYDECVIHEMKGFKSDAAARAAISSIRNKCLDEFSTREVVSPDDFEKKPFYRKISEKELDAIEASAIINQAKYDFQKDAIKVNIYNPGTCDIRGVKTTIIIAGQERSYTNSVEPIGTNSTGTLEHEIYIPAGTTIGDNKWRWSIAGAACKN